PHDQRGCNSETVYLFLQFLSAFARRFELRRHGPKLFGNLLLFIRGTIAGRLFQERALFGPNLDDFRRIPRIRYRQPKVAQRLAYEVRILANRNPYSATSFQLHGIRRYQDKLPGHSFVFARGIDDPKFSSALVLRASVIRQDARESYRL